MAHSAWCRRAWPQLRLAPKPDVSATPQHRNGKTQVLQRLQILTALMCYIKLNLWPSEIRSCPPAFWSENTNIPPVYLKHVIFCLAWCNPKEWLPFCWLIPCIWHWSRGLAWQWQPVVTALFSCCQGMCPHKDFTLRLPSVKSDMQCIYLHSFLAQFCIQMLDFSFLRQGLIFFCLYSTTTSGSWSVALYLHSRNN